MRGRILISAMLISLALLAMSVWRCTSQDTAQKQSEEPALAATDDETEVPTRVGGPCAYFPETIHDFGTAAKGLKHTHKFRVRNTGDAPLEIIKAKGG